MTDITLTSTSSIAAVNYNWAGPNGFTSNEQNPTVSEAGEYLLTVTTTDTGCSATATVNVTIPDCEYDLALIKILAPEQSASVSVGDSVDFIVKVTNQGAVNSGDFTVMDRLQEGLAFVSADMNGIHNNGVVTWELSDLEPGAFIELAIRVNVTTLGTGKFVNWAEISADSGDDEDSTPDNNTGLGFTSPNDLVENHNDMMLDNSPTDEDDNDFEEILIERGIFTLTRVYLQGPTMGADNAGGNTTLLMRDDLRIDQVIPTSEPYTTMIGYQHIGDGGNETVETSVFEIEGADAVVDWVVIELRDANDPTQILSTRTALLQRDGDVVDTDGTSPVYFENMEDGSYYVAVRHRNHLGIMTAQAVDLSSDNSPMVDFSDPTTITYGQHAQVSMGDKMAMWAGNVNNTGTILFQGPSATPNAVFFDVLTDANNTDAQANYVKFGYHQSDVNLSCTSAFQGIDNEVNPIFFNILQHPDNTQLISNYGITEQLP